MQSLQFTVILGSGYGNILQLFFPCNSFPFRPPPHLPFWFPYHLFGTCQFYLAQFLLGRIMFMLAGVLRVLYTEHFYSSYFSSSSPHSLFPWTIPCWMRSFPLSLCVHPLSFSPFVLRRTQTRDSIPYSRLYVCFISLSVIFSRCIHFPTNVSNFHSL